MGRLSPEQIAKARQILHDIEKLNRELQVYQLIDYEDYIRLDMYANFFYKTYLYKYILPNTPNKE